MEESSTDIRLSYSHIARVNFPVNFGGKAHLLNILKTNFGDFLATATQISMLLTDAADDIAAFEHFRTVSKRCSALQHNGELLQDHLEVPNVCFAVFRRSLGGHWEVVGVVGSSLGGRWGVTGRSLGGRWGVIGGSLGGHWEVVGGHWEVTVPYCIVCRISIINLHTNAGKVSTSPLLGLRNSPKRAETKML